MSFFPQTFLFSFSKTLTISDDERSVSFQATSAQRRYPGILHATCFTFLRILLISISTGGGGFGLYQTWKSAKVGNVNSTRSEMMNMAAFMKIFRTSAVERWERERRPRSTSSNSTGIHPLEARIG